MGVGVMGIKTETLGIRSGISRGNKELSVFVSLRKQASASMVREKQGKKKASWLIKSHVVLYVSVFPENCSLPLF